MNSNKKTTKKHGKAAKNQVETFENEEKTTKKPFKMNYDKKAQINNEVSGSQTIHLISCFQTFIQQTFFTDHSVAREIQASENMHNS